MTQRLDHLAKFLAVDGAVDSEEATLLNAAKTGFRLNGHPETESACAWDTFSYTQKHTSLA